MPTNSEQHIQKVREMAEKVVAMVMNHERDAELVAMNLEGVVIHWHGFRPQELITLLSDDNEETEEVRTMLREAGLHFTERVGRKEISFIGQKFPQIVTPRAPDGIAGIALIRWYIDSYTKEGTLSA